MEEYKPCMKLPVVVHVRKQREGEKHVSTREGLTPILPSDLIMRGVNGEEYPIGLDIFNKTYTFDLSVTDEIQQLRKQVAELRDLVAKTDKRNVELQQLRGNKVKENIALSLQVQVLREVLKLCVEANTWELGGEPIDTLMMEANTKAKEALNTTPSQDEWIKRSEIEAVWWHHEERGQDLFMNMSCSLPDETTLYRRKGEIK